MRALLPSAIVVSIIAYLCTAWSYPAVIGANRAELFSATHRDGWLESNAEFRVPDQLSFGNRLRFSFGGLHDPRRVLRLELCGDEVTTVHGGAPVVEVLIALDRRCEPWRLTMRGEPFQISERDRRQVIGQVQRISIESPIGAPIVSLRAAAGFMLLSVALFVFGARAFHTSAGRLFGWLLVFAAFWVHLSVGWTKLDLQLWLWWCAALIVIGMVAESRGKRESSFRAPNEVPALLIVLLVLAAAGLRFYGITFGLPNNYHPDEVPKVNAIMRMVEAGDLNPRYFLHPSLLLYSTYAVNLLLHPLSGLVDLGVGGSFRETAFLAGRVVSAVAGTASIYLVYALGRRLSTPRVGFFAAALLAVFPLHVVCSRYLKEDALLTFVVLCSTLAMVKSVAEDRPRLLALSALLAGFAASVKYSGILTIMVLAAAPWLRSGSIIPDQRWLGYTLLVAPLAGLGFVIGTPYSILDSGKFLKDFNSERHHMNRGHTTAVDSWSQLWMYHVSRSMPQGMTLPAVAASIIGLGILLRRGAIAGWFIVAMFLLFYLPAEYVKAKPAPQPERYIVPCLPFLALAAATTVASLARWRVLAAALIGAVVWLSPMLRSSQISSEISNDTRTQMAAWMINNLPAGSKVYLDWKPYAPRFWHNEFEVTYIMRAEILEKLRIDDLKRSGQEYLVLSGLFYDRYFTEPNSPAGPRSIFREVFRRVPVLKEFAPQYGTYGFHNPRVTLFSLREQDFLKLEAELAEVAAGSRAHTTNAERSSFPWRLAAPAGSARPGAP